MVTTLNIWRPRYIDNHNYVKRKKYFHNLQIYIFQDQDTILSNLVMWIALIEQNSFASINLLFILQSDKY